MYQVGSSITKFQKQKSNKRTLVVQYCLMMEAIDYLSHEEISVEKNYNRTKKKGDLLGEYILLSAH